MKRPKPMRKHMTSKGRPYNKGGKVAQSSKKS